MNKGAASIPKGTTFPNLTVVAKAVMIKFMKLRIERIKFKFE